MLSAVVAAGPANANREDSLVAAIWPTAAPAIWLPSARSASVGVGAGDPGRVPGSGLSSQAETRRAASEAIIHGIALAFIPDSEVSRSNFEICRVRRGRVSTCGGTNLFPRRWRG